MRKPINNLIEKYRVTAKNYKLNGSPCASIVSDSTYGNNGLFLITESKRLYTCVASDKMQWEHVSVSVRKGKKEKYRLPTWNEMCWIKNLFWDENETVVQYHPRKSDYVNIHEHVLHLWKPLNNEMPLPPKFMV